MNPQIETLLPEPAPATPVEDIPSTVQALRATFDTGKTRPAAFRRRQLEALRRMLVERERELAEALYVDLRKCETEAYATEIGFTANEIGYTLKHLDRWMQPRRVRTSLTAMPGRSEIHREPLGVVLIIGAWNYPVHLTLAPLIGALAAGNCVVLKPSEVAERTSSALARWLPKYLDPTCVKVVEGGVRETTVLLEQRFDHIFYTGNGKVGRIVMRAAAEHLTPVTLELGGKSPCIVDESADLDAAARRIAWAKFLNAGQTCVAPDYVLVTDAAHDALVHRVSAAIRSMYGDDPQQSPDYPRIVNERHLDRLAGLLGEGTLVCGGEVDRGDRYIAPTVLKDVPRDAAIMQDEIFGPILPVLRVADTDAATRFVNDRPKPLALYVFSTDARTQDRVLAQTSSGGAAVNHCILQLGVEDLPFGGVGESGMGAYHGERSFLTFTHQKAVLRKPKSMDPPMLFPPFTALKKRLIKTLL
ncbi:MAG: aldehyde dehydrogenase family protein [Myxococcales bacterium]|nr:aldehyde dehydrogenase family protein [Myxococcales bacterium]